MLAQWCIYWCAMQKFMSDICSHFELSCDNVEHLESNPNLRGTECHHLSSEINSHWQPFDNNWRQYFSGHPLARMLIP